MLGMTFNPYYIWFLTGLRDDLDTVYDSMLNDIYAIYKIVYVHDSRKYENMILSMFYRLEALHDIHTPNTWYR